MHEYMQNMHFSKKRLIPTGVPRPHVRTMLHATTTV